MKLRIFVVATCKEHIVEAYSPECLALCRNARHVIHDSRRSKWKEGLPVAPVDLIVTTLPETN